VSYPVAHGKALAFGVLVTPTRSLREPHLLTFVKSCCPSKRLDHRCHPFPLFPLSQFIPSSSHLSTTTYHHSSATSPLSSSPAWVDTVSSSTQPPLRPERWISCSSGVVDTLLFSLFGLIALSILALPLSLSLRTLRPLPRTPCFPSRVHLPFSPLSFIVSFSSCHVLYHLIFPVCSTAYHLIRRLRTVSYGLQSARMYIIRLDDSL